MAAAASPQPTSSTTAPALNRRSCLQVLIAGGSALLTNGCGNESDPSESGSKRSPSTVPLRVVIVGDVLDSESLQRAWPAVSDQPLDVQTVQAAAGDEVSAKSVAEAARRGDLLIYPAFWTGRLQQLSAIRRLREGFDGDDGAAPFLPAFEAVIAYGSDAWCLPLGSLQPMTLRPGAAAADPLAKPWTWAAYGEVVAGLPKGAAAEPLAPGWAAWSFLHRANQYCGSNWLFEPQQLRPQLASAPYLRALEELQRDAAKYPDQAMTPEDVEAAVREGKVQLAVGWPPQAAADDGFDAIDLSPAPGSDQVYASVDAGWQPALPTQTRRWVLFGGHAPVASLASGCRQTSAAEQFLRWISGEEGTTRIRAANPKITATRLPRETESSSPETVGSSYSDLLVEELTNDYVRPLLRIPGADEYVRALDEKVIAVVAGESSPEAALIDVCEAWEAITEQRTRPLQVKHWRLTRS